MERKVIYHDFQIDELEEGDLVRFCMNDFTRLPINCIFVGKDRYSYLKFSGVGDDKKTYEFRVKRYSLSGSRGGRIKIADRTTIPYEII